jgi:DNA-binding protein H-NS
VRWTPRIRLVKRPEISTNEVNTILKLDLKSLENQRRLRVQIIKDINQKIETYYHIEECIQRLNSKEDKRLNIHKIRMEVANIFSRQITTNKRPLLLSANNLNLDFVA